MTSTFSKIYFEYLVDPFSVCNMKILIKLSLLQHGENFFPIRGHTLITLAHKGTHLVCKMLTTVLCVRVVRYCSKNANKGT